MKVKTKLLYVFTVTAFALCVAACKKSTPPTVKIYDNISTTYTSANVTGEVTDEGSSAVTERGFIYGKQGESRQDTMYCGSGVGEFPTRLTGLEPNTTYNCFAFARNDGSIGTSGKVTFTTRDNDLPIVSTSEIENVGTTTATCGGNGIDDGGAYVTERGVCWSTNHNPAVSDSHVSSGDGLGEFTCNMTNLSANTSYYVRAYAKNSKGVGYGEEKSFTTLDFDLPVVATANVTDITQTSAKGGGEVTDGGGTNVTERGVCWSASHNPSVNDHKVQAGEGMGSFTANITGLSAHTTYYVRAYATNSRGTAYGNEVSFNTSANLPTVSTGSVTNITTSSATGSGNVTNDGGSTVTERGLCWSTNHSPTIGGQHIAAGEGTGNFSAAMTNLSTNTTYYMRAYAINGVGTSYGEEVEFTTLSISVPGVTTASVINITNTTATGGGNVISSGGAIVTERGICWSTSHNPTISGSHDSNGSGTGNYTVNMTGLSPNTTYYVKAYAINSEGIGYGEEVYFTTTEIANCTITVSANPTNGGTVTGGGTYQQGQSCTLRATASSDYTFQKWTKNGTQVSTNATYTFTVTESASYVAHFQRTTYMISASANPSSGGTVSGAGEYNYGENCTLRATPASNYVFLKWTKNGTTVSTNAVYTFQVTASASYVAHFDQQSYNISLSASPSNGGTVSGGGVHYYNQPCTVHAVANSGYTFVNWTENGNQVSTSADYSFTVTGNRTLVAHFTASKYAYASLGLGVGYMKYPIDNPNITTINPDIRLLGGDYYNGYLYAYGYTDPDDKYYFYKINATTGSIVSSTYVGEGGFCSDCTYDYTTNRLYGSYGGDLYIINMNTGARTYVGSFGLDGYMVALFCSSSGQLYGVQGLNAADYGNFYRINKSTCEVTLVATLSYFVNYAQSGGFDRETGTLYWAGFVSDTRSSGVEPSGGLATDKSKAEFYGIIATINPNTGSVTVLQTGTGEQCAWSIR